MKVPRSGAKMKPATRRVNDIKECFRGSSIADFFVLLQPS